VQRNLIKRRLREAFRLCQYDLPPGFDHLIVVRPHVPLTMAGYQAKLRHLMMG
jgi:ribonuclease P protein component